MPRVSVARINSDVNRIFRVELMQNGTRRYQWSTLQDNWGDEQEVLPGIYQAQVTSGPRSTTVNVEPDLFDVTVPVRQNVPVHRGNTGFTVNSNTTVTVIAP